MTLLILWKEYQSIHLDGYDIAVFASCSVALRSAWHPRCARNTSPATKFVDYSGKKVPIVDRKTGEIRVGVLGASSYTFAEATWTLTLPDWIGSHVPKHPCQPCLAPICSFSSSPLNG